MCVNLMCHVTRTEKLCHTCQNTLCLDVLARESLHMLHMSHERMSHT